MGSKVLAIDASLKHTGVAFRDGDSIISYTLDMKGGVNLSHDLHEIYQHFSTLHQEHHFTCIAKEGIAFGYPTWALPRLCEVAGVIRASISDLPVLEISPKTIKKLIAGSGNATKDQVMASIQSRLGIYPADDNQGDALAILLIAEVYAELAGLQGWQYGSKKVADKNLSKELESRLKTGV